MYKVNPTELHGSPSVVLDSKDWTEPIEGGLWPGRGASCLNIQLSRIEVVVNIIWIKTTNTDEATMKAVMDNAYDIEMLWLRFMLILTSVFRHLLPIHSLTTVTIWVASSSMRNRGMRTTCKRQLRPLWITCWNRLELRWLRKEVHLTSDPRWISCKWSELFKIYIKNKPYCCELDVTGYASCSIVDQASHSQSCNYLHVKDTDRQSLYALLEVSRTPMYVVLLWSRCCIKAGLHALVMYYTRSARKRL